MKQRCIWSEASTNPVTKKAEMPEVCKRKGCDGFQKEPLCENFIAKNVEPKLRKEIMCCFE